MDSGLKAYMTVGIENKRIHAMYNDNGEIEWVRTYCEKHYTREKGITTHIGEMHPETRKQKLQCPYCPESFCNIANLKAHMIKGSCANKMPNASKAPWEDIIAQNPTETRDEIEEKNNKSDLEKGYFERTELLFGRISVSNQTEGTAWRCNKCEKQWRQKRNFETT